MKDILFSKLTKTGLSQKEAVIYDYLLSSGGAFPSAIAKGTGMQRSTAYNILTALAIKGLVNEVKRRNKLYYQISSPSNLVRHARTMVHRAEEQLSNASNVLPQISDLFTQARKKPLILYFEGEKEVIEIYNDHVAGSETYEMRSLAGVDDIMTFISSAYHREYIQKKVKLKVKTRAIMPDTTTARSFLPGNYIVAEKKYWPVIRFTNKGIPIPGEVTLYGRNKVSIVNLQEKVLAGIIIEDEMIYNMISLLFELAWDDLGINKNR